MRVRPDRAMIRDEWIQRAIDRPAKERNEVAESNQSGNICGITVEHGSQRADNPRFSYEQVAA